MTAQRVAHRGAGERENTIPAFSRAVILGCDWIELDVRTTEDEVPIVLHDETLDRLWGLPLPVAEVTWRQVANLGNGEFAIPRLRDALEWAASAAISLMIDVTTARDALAALNTVRQMRVGIPIGWCGHVDAMRAIRRADPTAVVQFQHLGGDLDLVKLVSVDPQAVNAEWSLYTPALMEQIRAMGLRAWAWTVNEVEPVDSLLAMGIDAITTDDLRMLNGVLDWHRGPS